MQGAWKGNELFEAQVNQDVENGHYKGTATTGKPNGKGLMAYSFGGEYDGDWKEGKWDGKGCYRFHEDSVYGDWRNGKLDGKGVYACGDVRYCGDWEKGMPDGFGVYTLGNSFTYEGEFEVGRMNGYGEMKYANGDRYEGNWVNSLQNGQGAYTFNDGSSYEGNWVDGRIEGEGVMRYANGDVYSGNFHEGAKTKSGLYIFADGKTYEGQFNNDRMDGCGIIQFSDTVRYEGEISDGKIKGLGTMFVNIGGDSVAITGYWNGKDQFPQQVSVLFSNGDVYEGAVKNKQLQATGKWSNVKDVALKANDLYKSHQDTWEKACHVIGLALMGVEVISWPLSLVPYVGPMASVVGKGAHIANTVLYATDIVVTSSSAAMDIAEGISKHDLNMVIGGMKNIGSEVVWASLTRCAPKFLKKKLKPVGNIIKSGNPFQKVVRIGSDGKGGYIVIRESAKARAKGKTKGVFRSKYLRSLINKSKLMKDLEAIKAKGKIELSEEEIKQLLDNPKDNLRAFIKAYTGSKNNFQEFFIRVAMHDPKVAKKLLENPTIRQYVDRSIRRSGGGGNHEWLMTKNFSSFLTDPKWGDDGAYLALALTRFVQKTDKVIFKEGGSHHHENSGKFHNELSKIIDRCDTPEELFLEIKKYAKKELSKESYEEFKVIFKEVFSADRA